MKRAIIILIFLCGLLSCSTVKYVPIYQKDTTHVKNTEYLRDSIYVYKDRITEIKGDTVYVTNIEYKDRFKIKEVHDTLYKEKVKIETHTEYVEKNLTGWQKMLQYLGYAFFVLLVGLLIYFSYKLYKRFKI